VSRNALNLAIAVAAAALLGGCGSDNAPIEPVSTSTTSTTTGSLSQSDFIVSADARCGEANAALANLSSGTDAAATTATQERSITQGLLQGLQGIGTAEDPDGSLDAYYSALDDEVRILKQQETAIASGDTATADSLDADLEAAKTAAADAASQYGFQECGQQGTTLPSTGVSGTSGTAVPSATTTAPATTTPVTPTTPPPTPPPPAAPTTPPSTGGGTPSGSTGGSTGGSSGSSGGIGPG
jgi:hypothetical protein